MPPTAPDALSGHARPFPGSHCALLLVEDEVGDATLIEAYLRIAFSGRSAASAPLLETQRATTLGEALAAAAATPPDLVLLDLHLPDSAGLASFERFAARHPAVPIIVLTGLDDDALAVQAMEAGAQDFLVKGSFDAAALGRAVSHAVIRSGLRAELAEARDGLERAVAERTAELKQRIAELEAAQAAFTVLLAERDRERREAGEHLARDLRQQVTPFLRTLARSRLDASQKRLLDVATANLAALGRDKLRLAGTLGQLTPAEVRVALLIRQGLPSKEIAEALSLSPETVGIHRKHIRAKLGLQHGGSNLRAFLMALDD